jgi:hypothetical protein
MEGSLLLEETDGLAGAQLWDQLGPVVGALLSLMYTTEYSQKYPLLVFPERSILSLHQRDQLPWKTAKISQQLWEGIY